MPNPDGPPADLFQPGGALRLGLLSDAAAQALAEALRLARETHWDCLRSPHVFMGLLTVPDAGVRCWGRHLGEDLAALRRQFQEMFHQAEGDPDAVLVLHREFLSDNVIRLLRDAQQRAAEHGRGQISTLDLLISLFTVPNSIVAECFQQRSGVTADHLAELALRAEREASA
jgi:ATP-dependent Clp protease ATP-binding subunit ClpA